MGLNEVASKGDSTCRSERNVVGAYVDQGLVFAAPDGQPWNPASFSAAFIKFAQEAGLPRLRFHDLRHSHATQLLRLGIHPKIVSERLGHATTGITLDLYSHVVPGMQEDAAAQVDKSIRAAIDASAGS